MAMFSITELDELKKKYDSPAQQQQPQGPNKRRLADVNNVEEQPAPAKPAPVAAPKEKIVHGMIITRRRKQKS
jgi:hypothetical protein